MHTYAHQDNSKAIKPNHFFFILMNTHLFILSVPQLTPVLERTSTYYTSQGQAHRNL